MRRPARQVPRRCRRPWTRAGRRTGSGRASGCCSSASRRAGTAQGDDIVAIPGTRRAKSLEENLAAAELSLSPEVLARIDAIAPHGIAVGERYPAPATAQVDA